MQLATKGAEYASKILFRIGFDVDFLGSGGQSAEVGEGLPRARQVELAELLRQFHRLHNHTLGLVIVTHLRIFKSLSTGSTVYVRKCAMVVVFKLAKNVEEGG